MNRNSYDNANQGYHRNSGAMNSIEIHERDSLAFDESQKLIREDIASAVSLKTELTILLEVAIGRNQIRAVCPLLHAAFKLVNKCDTWHTTLLSARIKRLARKRANEKDFGFGLDAMYRKMRKSMNNGLSTSMQLHIAQGVLKHRPPLEMHNCWVLSL